MRGPAFESLNDQGRGRSAATGALVPEAVWKCGVAGSGAPRKGDRGPPGAAEETGAVCGQTASGTWAGTAASLLPGTLRTGFIPAAVWRNSSKVKLYLGERTAKVVWQFLLTHDL